MKANYNTKRTYREFSKLPPKQQEIINNYIEEQINERLTKERIDALDIGFDIATQTALLVLIDNFWWGTREIAGKESRIKNFMKWMQERFCQDSDKYDDAFRFALQYQLKERGLIYEITRAKDLMEGNDNN